MSVCHRNAFWLVDGNDCVFAGYSRYVIVFCTEINPSRKLLGQLDTKKFIKEFGLLESLKR